MDEPGENNRSTTIPATEPLRVRNGRRAGVGVAVLVIREVVGVGDVGLVGARVNRPDERARLVVPRLELDVRVAEAVAQAYEVLSELHELSQHRYVPHHMSALVYAGLGDTDETPDRLDRAYEERSYFMPALGRPLPKTFAAHRLPGPTERAFAADVRQPRACLRACATESRMIP